MKVEVSGTVEMDVVFYVDVDDDEYTEWLDGAESDNTTLKEFLIDEPDLQESWVWKHIRETPFRNDPYFTVVRVSPV